MVENLILDWTNFGSLLQFCSRFVFHLSQQEIFAMIYLIKTNSNLVIIILVMHFLKYNLFLTNFIANEVCSNYISPVVFFMRFSACPIFRLTLLTFRPQKRDRQTGSAQRALCAHRAFQLCFSSNCFGELYLYLWCEWRFLELEDTPTVERY